MADAGKARICLRAPLGGLDGLDIRKMYEARRRRNEPAGAVVERGEGLVEVDLQPLAPGLLRVAHGDADELGADPRRW